MTTLINLNVKNRLGQPHSLKIDDLPDSCPICHRGIQPIGLGCDYLIDEVSPQIIERLFRCSLKACQRTFIAVYRGYTNAGVFQLSTCRPQDLKSREFSEELNAVSPDFCAIWNEAHKAEQSGWLLVCGPGYRKALEFLIKDYVSREQSDKTKVEEIQKLQLMPCIKNYVDDANIKATAERAVWLGNDETHYVRKWEDKELKDLKTLIELVCYWIQSKELTKTFTTTMPQGKP